MQKKAVGIMFGVAAAHALLLSGLLLSGGCKHPEILGTRGYETGPSPSTDVAAPAETSVPAASSTAAVPAPAAAAVAAPAEAAAAAPAKTEVPATPKNQLPGLDSIQEPPPGAAPAAGSMTYVVKSGDTLSGIAYRYGVKTQTLAVANGLTLKSVLKVGQKLQLPEGAVDHPERAKRASSKKAAAKKSSTGSQAAAAAATPALENGVYTVKSGDTLGKIGYKFHVSANAIAKANNISVKKVLQIGDKLVIPVAGAAVTATTAAAVTTAAPAAAAATSAAPDPFAGVDAAAAAAPAAAVAAEPAAAPAAPVADAVATTPVTAPAAPAEAPAATEAAEVQDDTTVDAFCRANGYKKEDVIRLNPDLPADGKVKRGQFLVVPSL